MHFIYDYFIIQLKCFNAFNWFFISQLDPGAQKDQIPERWPGLHWNSQCKGSSIAFSCIVTVSPIPSIALSVHCLSWSVIFSLSISSTLVQDYIALVEYSALCTTLKCTAGPSVSLSLSLANGRTEAQGLLAAPSLSRSHLIEVKTL